MTPLLNERQERFVQEYLLDYNASAAARRAGYSARTARMQACALMKLPQVRARVNAGMDAMRERLRNVAEEAMRARMRAAFFDVRKMFDASGKLLPLDQMDPDTAAALIVRHQVLASGETVTHLRQPPRLPALLELMRILDLGAELEAAVARDAAAAAGAGGEAASR